MISQASDENAADCPTLTGNLGALRDFAVMQHFARNTAIYCEGEAARTIYRIIDGTVRLCRHTAGGRRHIAEFLLPGDIFGIVAGTQQPLAAEAVTAVTLTAYPRAHFDRMTGRDARAQANVLSYFSQSLASARHHHFVLGCQTARERVASFLLRFAARNGARPGERIDLTMGRQDIADHLGLTIETVSRAITALKSEGVITVPNAHQLVLNDLAALNGVALAA